jgi:hypothetical protein
VTTSFTLLNPEIDFALVWAFERAKLCEVWGELMHSSKACAVWPIFQRELRGVSGLNMTGLTINITDFDFTMVVSGLGGKLDGELAAELERALLKAKPEIIANLPTAISAGIRAAANKQFMTEIPATQRRSPCVVHSLAPNVNTTGLLNVSEVCFVNNAGFDLRWGYQDCPANTQSKQTSPYPIDTKVCMAVKDGIPTVAKGDTLRLTTSAVLGIKGLAEPGLQCVAHFSFLKVE